MFWRRSLLIQSFRVAAVLCALIFLLFLYFNYVSEATHFSTSIDTGYLNLRKCVIEEMHMKAKKIDIKDDISSLKITGTFTINDSDYNNRVSCLLNLKPVLTDTSIYIIPLEKDDITCLISAPPASAAGNIEERSRVDSVYNESYSARGVTFYDNKLLWVNALSSEGIRFIGDFRIVLSGYEVDVSSSNESINSSVVYVDIRRGSASLSQYFHKCQLHNPQCEKLFVSMIQKCGFRCDGTVSVDYMPETKKYEIKDQNLVLESKNSNLFADIMSIDKKYKIDCNGYANQIKLSGNSLIPNFVNTLKENAYVSPTLFVTVIAGAISLIKIDAKLYKKKEKKTEEA